MSRATIARLWYDTHIGGYVAETLEGYFKQISRGKLLTREEEVSLSQKIEAGDKRARDKMIESNLRLAISIAKRHQRPGCNLDDLIQESNIGLIKAVDRFDWRRGFKFSTYASWWIKQSVRRHVTDTSSNIRVPAHTTALAWRISVFVDEYEREFNVKPSILEIAEMMNVSQHAVEEVMLRAGVKNMISLDSVMGDEGSKSLAEIIPDENLSEPDVAIDHARLMLAISKCLDQLTPREEQVLRLRFGVSDIFNNQAYEVSNVAT